MNYLSSRDLLEVIAIVMTTFVMVDVSAERPVRKGDAVPTRVDNEAAIAWVQICRRGRGERQARVGALIRMVGALEAREGGISGKACTRR